MEKFEIKAISEKLGIELKEVEYQDRELKEDSAIYMYFHDCDYGIEELKTEEDEESIFYITKDICNTWYAIGYLKEVI